MQLQSGKGRKTVQTPQGPQTVDLAQPTPAWRWPEAEPPNKQINNQKNENITSGSKTQK